MTYGRDLVELDLNMYSSNDVFVENPSAAVAKILRNIANEIEFGGPEIDKWIYDDNGNKVGAYCLEINEDFDS